MRPERKRSADLIRFAREDEIRELARSVAKLTAVELRVFHEELDELGGDGPAGVREPRRPSPSSRGGAAVVDP